MDIKRNRCWLITIIIAALHLPSHAYFSLYQAQQCYEHDNKKQAQEILGTAIARDTSNWRALCNLGTVSFNEQEYAEAIKHFDKALEVNPACQEARERRDHAKKILEESSSAKASKDRQAEQEKDKQNTGDKTDDTQDAQKEKQDGQSQEENEENQKNKLKNQSQKGDKQSPAKPSCAKAPEDKQEQQTQQPKLDQQNQDAKNDANEKQHQESYSAKASKDRQEQQPEHNTSHQENEQLKQDKNTASQCTDKPEKLKDGWDAIPLTKREKEIVELVEDTDKAAQQYMMMRTRKARQHDSQKNW